MFFIETQVSDTSPLGLLFLVYGVMDLKNKSMKLCVTYKIKLYKVYRMGYNYPPFNL